jgi:hypothetical protein
LCEAFPDLREDLRASYDEVAALRLTAPIARSNPSGDHRLIAPNGTRTATATATPCRRIRGELDVLFKDSGYGENERAFKAYFFTTTPPPHLPHLTIAVDLPRCIACGCTIDEHHATEVGGASLAQLRDDVRALRDETTVLRLNVPIARANRSE